MNILLKNFLGGIKPLLCIQIYVCFTGATLALGYALLQYTSLIPYVATATIPLDSRDNTLSVNYSYKGVNYTDIVYNNDLISINPEEEKQITGFISKNFPKSFYLTKSINWLIAGPLYFVTIVLLVILKLYCFIEKKISLD